MSEGRATGIECDVHVSLDGALVVIHDKTLDRTTNGHGRVRAHSLRSLRQLDAAHWWVEGEVDNHHAAPSAYVHRGKAPADMDYGVPTMPEVVEAFPAVPMTVEVKTWRAAWPLVDLLAAEGSENVTITSFFDPILWLVRWRMRQHGPWRAPLAPGLGYTVWFWMRTRLPTFLGGRPRRSRYARLQIPLRKAGIRFATKRLVSRARAAGMGVDVWTIDDAPTMTSLINDVEVDGIMTDRPSLLAQVVEG
jgi:glycerophosphoryl diester phosphodiesterase